MLVSSIQKNFAIMASLSFIIGWCIINAIAGSSINQPKLCPNAVWNPNATTFADNRTIGLHSHAMFINRDNTLVRAAYSSFGIFIWLNGSLNLTKTINNSILYTSSVFVTNDNEILASNENGNSLVSRWNLRNGSSLPSINMSGLCYSLFVDINNDLYCSQYISHRVVKKPKNDTSNSITVVAGNGTAGSRSTMLNRPLGIFVTSNLDLYVADYLNNRIQLFRSGQRNATTIVGNGSNRTITLSYPRHVILDANRNLFIADSNNNRIIRSGIGGDQCIVGCTGLRGSAANQLSEPWTLNFDNQGNLFVVDHWNSRIQKFQLISNECECYINQMSIIPGISTISSPIQIRREEDFYLSSSANIICNGSFQLSYQWNIYNCSSPPCLAKTRIINSNLLSTSNEYFLPARTLPLGFYVIELIVTLRAPPSALMTSSRSIYLLITPSGITANLVLLGTSMITSGIGQDLRFNPGEYSVDLDDDYFNASEWNYEYYCRIYGLAYFPNYQGQLLTIDDPRTDLQNPSCFRNQSVNGSRWIYDGSTQSPKSSITILVNTFVASNQTYQWMVRMSYKRNASQQATGYLLVRVENTQPKMIIIGCVIQTMCIPNLEYQFVNPTTQVSLYSFCFGQCSSILNITWNIYQGVGSNVSSNTTQWTLFNQMQTYENRWFFGRFTKNFTSISNLFLAFPQIELWRFEVVYGFTNEQSRSSLNFRINRPPSNGSCSISPQNGTTMTTFSVSCPSWVDEDYIKDYSLYSLSSNQSEWIFVTFSIVSDFDALFPPGVHQLMVFIRDKRDCVTQWNLSSILVEPEKINMSQILSTTNPIARAQVTNIISSQMNQNNDEVLQNATSNGIPLSSISVSSLGGSPIISTTTTSNSNVSWDELSELLSEQANNREQLMKMIEQIQITTSNSLKLLSTTLVQLTSSTNELTRNTLTMASQRCLAMGKALRKMSKRISFEDLELITRLLHQCSTNLLTAVNGPLQERMIVLKSDFLAANRLPDDYDTDLESPWSNPNLFADGNDFSTSTIEKGRNIFYQNQLKEKIQEEMNELSMELTNGLNVHLNLNQSFLINTSSIIVAIEKLPVNAFLNRTIADQQIFFPSKLNFSSNQSESLRFTMERLPSFDNQKNQSISTNLSRVVSLSLLDSNGKTIEVKASHDDPFVIWILHDRSFVLPEMSLQNVTTLTNFSLFNYHFISLNSQANQSIHLEFESLNTTLSYLFVYRFDLLPIYNRSHQLIDGSFLFCSSNSNVFNFYLDNEQTFGHRSIFIGIGELNGTEVEQFCLSNRSNQTFERDDQRRNFTSNYFLRSFQSGCFYFDEQNRLKSDGLRVGPLTNHYQTQCFSQHLTSFTSSFAFLPPPIEWNRVFQHADFMKNPTIYLTVIISLLFYILLMIYARYFDRKDFQRCRMKMLIDNHRDDEYFYQILVFTGQRKAAGTKSNIYFVLSGDETDTNVRRLKTSEPELNKMLFQHGNIDSFLLSTSKPSGSLNYLHIWHDNAGDDQWASWFLKCFIVKDLQSQQRFFFIAQRWFAVEKEDGKIERLIPLANDQEREQMNFLLTKQLKMKFTDDHLWFSIFSYSKSNRLTRTQRCTLCFLLFFFSLLFNILYYNLSTISTSSSFTFQFGPISISLQQVIVGVMIELFVLIPSLFFLQAFRYVQSTSKPLLHILLYLLSFLAMFTSIFFIIVRGLEFGETKSQQWLISILTGFFSSILITQPIKILCLSIFVICLRQTSKKDRQIDEYLNDEVLPSQQDTTSTFIRYKKRFPIHRLDNIQLDLAREHRQVEIRMFFFLRSLLIAIFSLVLISFFIHLNTNDHAFEQVQHLKSFLTNERNKDTNFHQITTINEFWSWLKESFVPNIRAQAWYNDQPAQYLNGYLNDKTNRHIGWPMIKQIRHRASSSSLFSWTEEKSSFTPGWINETTIVANRSVEKAFQYQTNEHSSDYRGYIYEFRGRLKDLQSNLSTLHQNQWIDSLTRRLLIRLNVYNPNVQLFSSVSFLIKILPTGALDPQMFIDSINLTQLSSVSQWICVILLFITIIYLMLLECRLMMKLRREYFRRFWSWIEWTFIVCSMASIVFFFIQYDQIQRLGQVFAETHGYSYIDMNNVIFTHRLFKIFISFSGFFSILRFLHLCQYHHRLSLFARTLSSSINELVSFSLMFSVVFSAFVCLFYLLFVSKISTCATVFQTSRMLFEMSLLKFDAHELSEAASFLGPVTFTLFILIIVFICLSMFLSIINDSFRKSRISIDDDRMGVTDEKLNRPDNDYVDSIEDFPNKIDQLTDIINRMFLNQKNTSVKFADM